MTEPKDRTAVPLYPEIAILAPTLTTGRRDWGRMISDARTRMKQTGVPEAEIKRFLREVDTAACDAVEKAAGSWVYLVEMEK